MRKVVEVLILVAALLVAGWSLPIKSQKSCMSCSGTGNSATACYPCDGKGKKSGFQCSFCKGTGWNKCSSCGGDGAR
ncbi:hypothetical protein M0R72_14810 [Candidatus Pacearchaeota archaeon]|jgi:DnaJ-class molecular chaperone|nr:hypothetical protein [Candidatus Pacearchaeota archaeon]